MPSLDAVELDRLGVLAGGVHGREIHLEILARGADAEGETDEGEARADEVDEDDQGVGVGKTRERGFVGGAENLRVDVRRDGGEVGGAVRLRDEDADGLRGELEDGGEHSHVSTVGAWSRVVWRASPPTNQKAHFVRVSRIEIFCIFYRRAARSFISPQRRPRGRDDLARARGRCRRLESRGGVVGEVERVLPSLSSGARSRLRVARARLVFVRRRICIFASIPAFSRDRLDLTSDGRGRRRGRG